MEKVITTKEKDKVAISTRSSFNNAFFHLTLSYKKETLTNEGLASEKVIGTEYPSGMATINFQVEDLENISKIDIQKLLTDAFEDMKSKM